MKLKFVLASVLLSLGVVPALLAAQEDMRRSPAPVGRKPDLVVQQFLFPPTYDKGLRVRVANLGATQAAPSVLRLTVRKIKGVAAARTMEVNLPVVAAGSGEWVLMDAKNILPNDVSLTDTTFRLNADATSLVSETNENNNEKWHNLD